VIAWTQKDLIVRAAGATFLIECKRPQSKKGVKSSIKDATSQLVDHFMRYKAGLIVMAWLLWSIALAVSRLRTVTSAYAIPPVGITPSQRTVFTVKRRTIFSVSLTL
jgi:hypothetical protein